VRRLSGGLLLAACLVLPALAPAAAAVDLAGTWYVLVHYRDSQTANPEVLRWEDRLWEFAKQGDRLEWTDYPIVVFSDKTGRFEGRHRVLHAWEPNAAQWSEIAAGIPVNSRGSTSKTLRRGEESGWTSSRGATARSGFVTFTQTWTIEGLDGLPVITWRDSMGSADTGSLSGVTRFTARAVDDGGDLIAGRYERDGHREGTFRMIRAGSARGLQSDGRTPNQKVAERVYQQVIDGTLGRELFVEALTEELAEYRIDPRDVDVEALVDGALARLRSGQSAQAVERWIATDVVARLREQAFGFASEGATHDPAARYALPFDPSVPRRLTQGVNGEFSHTGRHGYSFDFAMPEGTPVLAARAGEVVHVSDGYTEGGRSRSLVNRANAVQVLHADGTWATYAHFAPGLEVAEGQRVEAGDLLGRSGNTGYTTHPHLHFAVWRRGEGGDVRTVDVRFDDGSPQGFVPAEGLYYGGDGAAAESASR